MENRAFLFVNSALVVGCIAMAMVFLVLPLPLNKGLNKYRISLRFLAGAYLTLAFLETIVMAFELNEVNFIGIRTLTIASLQASLFTFTLITLINPTFITRHYLYKQLMPILFFVILYIFVAANWGSPRIVTFPELKLLAWHPAIVVREAFTVYYVFWLIYLVRLFNQQTRKYQEKIDNYFADSTSLRLPWVQYCFYAALTVGVLALLSCFMFTIQMLLFYTIAYTIFYQVFALYYIQYSRTFIFIEPAIFPPKNIKEEFQKINKRLMWIELKALIIAEKYYLKTGVNIEDMAHFLKIGRTSLSVFINKEEGMNFNAWINFLRIEEAKVMFLKYPDYNIIEISEMVGYSESSNFSRQFKVITKESPSCWRQTHKS